MERREIWKKLGIILILPWNCTQIDNITTKRREPIVRTELNTGDLDILIRTLIGEARGEGLEGQIAVAHVIINRTNNPQWTRDNTIAMTCLRRRQFSCWNIDDPNFKRIKNEDVGSEYYKQALLAANRALDGSDTTKGSLHYHAKQITPNWAKGKDPVLKLGNHYFYNDVD